MPPGRFAPAYVAPTEEELAALDAELAAQEQAAAIPPPPPTMEQQLQAQLDAPMGTPAAAAPAPAPVPAPTEPLPQPAYLPESSAYQPTPAAAPVPPPTATPSAPGLGGYYAAGGAPVGGVAVPSPAQAPPPTSVDFSSGQPVEAYDPSGGYAADAPPRFVDESDRGRVAAARDAANQRERQRGIDQVQALERAMMLGPESQAGITAQDILGWRPPGNTLDAGAPVATDAGFIWGPPLWGGSPSVARTVPRRQYTPGPRGEVPAPVPIVSSRRVPPPENLPISEPPGSTGVPRTEPYRQPTEPLLVDRYGNPFRTAETVVPPPEPSAGQPYVRQTRGDPRFGPGEVIPPPQIPKTTGRFGRAVEPAIPARNRPVSQPVDAAPSTARPTVSPPPAPGTGPPVFARRPTVAELAYRGGRVVGRASLTPPGQAAVRAGEAAGGAARTLITPKTVIPSIVAAGLLMQANWEREYGQRGGTATTQPAPVPTPDEEAPDDLRPGETESPRETGMVYITDEEGAFVGVRDADGTPVYFPDGATDEEKDAIVADVQSRLTEPAAVESPAGGGAPVESITPLATGTAAAGEAGGTPNAGTPLLTPDGTDTGLTLTSDGTVSTDRGSSGGGYRPRSGASSGYSRGGSRSGGSSSRGGSRRKKGKKSRGGFGSSPFGEGFPFDRQNTPMREYILRAIAESLANSRNSRT